MRVFALLILLLSVNACEDDITGFLVATSLTTITCEQAYLELHSNCHTKIPTAPEYDLWNFCCAYCTCPDCNSPSYEPTYVTYEPTAYGYGSTAPRSDSKEPYESTAFILICTGLTLVFVVGWVILYFQLTNKGFWEPERAKKLQPFEGDSKEANMYEVQKIPVDEESDEEEPVEPSSNQWVDSPRSFSDHARHQSSHSHLGRRNHAHAHARFNSAPAQYPPPGFFPGAGPPPVFNPYPGVAPSYFGHTPGMPPPGGMASRLGVPPPGTMGPPMMQPPPGPVPHMGYYNPHHPSRPLESSQYSRGNYNDDESSQGSSSSTRTSSQSNDNAKEDSDGHEDHKEETEENSGTSAPKDDDRPSSEEVEEQHDLGGDSMERIDDNEEPTKRFIQTASNDSNLENNRGIHAFFA